MDEILAYINNLERSLYVVPNTEKDIGFNDGARFTSQSIKSYIRKKVLREPGGYEVEWHDYKNGNITYHGVYDTEVEALESIYDWWKHMGKPSGPHVMDAWEEDDCTIVDYGNDYCFYKIRDLHMKDVVKNE